MGLLYVVGITSAVVVWPPGVMPLPPKPYKGMGLGGYEGRGWRWFHHHASMSIAAYGFLMAQRLKAGGTSGGKKNFIERKVPAVPEDYIPRGSPTRTTPRTGFDHLVAPALERGARRRAGFLPTLQLG